MIICGYVDEAYLWKNILGDFKVMYCCKNTWGLLKEISEGKRRVMSYL